MLELVVNKSESEIQQQNLFDNWIAWECMSCGFRRAVLLSELILTTRCPICSGENPKTA